MLFNSHAFVFVFLPVALLGYSVASRFGRQAAKYFLLAASVAFYAFSGWNFLLYLLTSVLVNFILSRAILRSVGGRRITWLVMSLTANVGALFVAKYYGFFVANINQLFSTDWGILCLIVPLGISFFTFSQISFSMGAYRGELPNPSFGDYALYVFYFPKLLMGPIVEAGVFFEQLKHLDRPDVRKLCSGVQLFFFGLFKKTVIADALVSAVSYGFNSEALHSSADVLITMLAYTFEIYFDFSGYTDMAIGISKMMGIDLPINFDSPYRALSVRDFWKRWHLTLTGFLTRYVYFPLGGSRRGPVRTYINILVVFLVSGLWHGANWTFVIWGLLHGILMIRERMMERFDRRIPVIFRWLGMFALTNFLWALFRSESISAFKMMIRSLLAFEFSLDAHLMGAATGALPIWALLTLSFVLCLFATNTSRREYRPTVPAAVLTSIAAVWSLCSLGSVSFVYFNF